ncbi:Uma2 family endonuclease [Nocardia sp. NPDC051052]|uniref:Uma2 family endonuclease n=1 Tax=Nocardia sp. NPDC051052 TaxID=3364322 RepID=UPI00379AD82A
MNRYQRGMMSAVFDWARVENLQPEPVTVEIWQQLHEDFRQLVEVTNGNIIRTRESTRIHREAVGRIADVIGIAVVADRHQHNGYPLDVHTGCDIVLWAEPQATIRRPDAALLSGPRHELLPLPAHQVKLVVEVVSDGISEVDALTKKTMYAMAGIPWYWIVWVTDTEVTSIEIYVLDHLLGQYRAHHQLRPGNLETVIEGLLRTRIDWDHLSGPDH